MSTMEEEDDDDVLPLSRLFPPSQQEKRARATGLSSPFPRPKGSRLFEEVDPRQELDEGAERVVSSLRKGDLVWVKAFSYLWWPGIVRRRKRSKALVSFFRVEKPQWFLGSRILGFEENCSLAMMAGGRLSEDIGRALEELGRRTLLGLTCSCWRSVGVEDCSLSARQIDGVRKGFSPVETLRFVLARAVCGRVGDDDNDDGIVSAVRVAAQVIAFRLYVSTGGNNGGVEGRFCAAELLGLVRDVAVCPLVCDLGAAEVSGTVVHVTAFRRFVSVTPVWVFRKLSGTGNGVYSDDSDDSTSDSCSDDSEDTMGVPEGNNLRSLYDSSYKKRELRGNSSTGESKILKSIPRTILETKMEKECSTTIVGSQCKVGDFSAVPIPSPVVSLPRTITSSDVHLHAFRFNSRNTLYLQGMLEQLHLIASDPCYFEAESYTSLYKCVKKFRKLTYQNGQALASASDATVSCKLKANSRLSVLEPEWLRHLTGDSNRIHQVDKTICGNDVGNKSELSPHGNLGKATANLDDCFKSTFMEVRIPKQVEDFPIEESIIHNSFPETISETEKEHKVNAIIMGDGHRESELSAMPAVSPIESWRNVTSSTKEQLPVFPVKRQSACHIKETLKQLQSIAANPCYYRMKGCKLTYKNILKYRDMIYKNVPNLECLKDAAICGYTFNLSNRLSVLEPSQLSHFPNDATRNYRDDRINYRNDVTGKSELFTADNLGKADTSIEDSRDSTSFNSVPDEKVHDQAIDSNLLSDMCETDPLPQVHVDDAYVLKPRTGTTTIFSEDMILKPEATLLIESNHGSKRKGYNDKCGLKVEEREASRNDQLIRAINITKIYSDNQAGTTHGAKKEVLLPLCHYVNEMQVNEKVRTETPFPSHLNGDDTDCPHSLETHINANRSGSFCEDSNVKVDSGVKDHPDSCEASIKKRLCDEPFSADNPKMCKTLPITSEEEIPTATGDKTNSYASKCAVDSTERAQFLVNSGREDIRESQGEACAQARIIDAKNDSVVGSCSLTLPTCRSSDGFSGMIRFDQTVSFDQSKLHIIQPALSLGGLYTSPLVDCSKPTNKVRQTLANDRCAGLSTCLHMKFAKGVSLPSKEELEQKFGMFGPLDHSRTKVFFFSGAAQVVFLHPHDAKTAYRYVKRKESFIRANTCFWFDEHEKFREAKGGQALSLLTAQWGLTPKSCLKKPNIHREKGQRKNCRVRFSVDNGPGSLAVETAKKNPTCHSSFSSDPSMEPDISGPMLKLLAECDKLVDKIKKTLAMKTYYYSMHPSA